MLACIGQPWQLALALSDIGRGTPPGTARRRSYETQKMDEIRTHRGTDSSGVGGVCSSGGRRKRGRAGSRNAGTVLDEILNVPDGIPQKLLDKADCVVIFPSVVKAAFGVGGSYGRGVMTCRQGESFSGKWGAPTMMALEGGSFGFQLGGQATDFVLLVMNDRGAKGILSSKVKFGADASAAAGPKGRDASAETDVTARAEILSYSRSRGAFAGVSLEGSTIRPDSGANEKVYGHKVDPTADRSLRNHADSTGRPAVGRHPGQQDAAAQVLSAPRQSAQLAGIMKALLMLSRSRRSFLWRSLRLLPPELRDQPHVRVTRHEANTSSKKSAKCPECHTPRDQNNQLDRDRWLQGAPIWIQPVVRTPNWAAVRRPWRGFTNYTDEQMQRVLERGEGVGTSPI